MKKIVALLLLTVFCFSLVSCGKKTQKAIVGTWKCSEDSFEMTAVFEKDGTGTFDDGELRWKYDKELDCYIVCHSIGETGCIYEIKENDEGKRYFKLSGYTFYYQV